MDSKQSGWQHFAEADWAAARDAFAAALDAEPGDPEALDGLGQSLWWLGERDAAIERRREAYAAYQRRGSARDAGRLAAYLAGECRIDGRDAEAAGWIARARRLLGGVGAGREVGRLAIEEAKRAGDVADAERHAGAALALAHELGDADTCAPSGAVERLQDFIERSMTRRTCSSYSRQLRAGSAPDAGTGCPRRREISDMRRPG